MADEFIGNILVPKQVATAIFPLEFDYPGTILTGPVQVTHPFLAADGKREQRFRLGKGMRTWRYAWGDLYETELTLLRVFWNSMKGPYQRFFLNAPNEDGTTTTVMVHFGTEPLTYTRFLTMVSQVGVTFVEEIFWC